jgi:hypothetical protein
MLSFTDVMHLFTHKLASLCRGRLPLAFSLARLLNSLFLVLFSLHINAPFSPHYLVQANPVPKS